MSSGVEMREISLLRIFVEALQASAEIRQIGQQLEFFFISIIHLAFDDVIKNLLDIEIARNTSPRVGS